MKDTQSTSSGATWYYSASGKIAKSWISINPRIV